MLLTSGLPGFPSPLSADVRARVRPAPFIGTGAEEVT
jgi:hypothetical protein